VLSQTCLQLGRHGFPAGEAERVGDKVHTAQTRAAPLPELTLIPPAIKRPVVAAAVEDSMLAVIIRIYRIDVDSQTLHLYYSLIIQEGDCKFSCLNPARVESRINQMPTDVFVWPVSLKSSMRQ
jgi:hypothetical protein